MTILPNYPTAANSAIDLFGRISALRREVADWTVRPHLKRGIGVKSMTEKKRVIKGKL